MTNATHTKGPWTTYIKGGVDGWITAADGNLIACAVRYESMQANAALIAAAPDMLAASEAFMSELDSGDNFMAWEKAKAELRAAIAKAKGLTA